ncbi:tyrosine-type recombinase/integrase [Amycolatopsis acidiphila]|uniref:Tyrosine-type recombinase/integrase n=1 Tax=Amycolatopsis acidiphila TaxID=715473 RepID=A0A558AMX3_9PSEU|nr:tyrosine-type recombinase/integrase [Amycolatopsis acidiphila]TVT25595.1 tyrosine-type recombinase/integrase [Amycolatopsis acidiphila]GHG90563.1 hypothetical protein GCM10017788_66270 [Amycolatopsis acidiphila]
MTSHNFRKTAATLLDEAGLTVREIADRLGHKRASMTLDTYFGRKQASPKVAELPCCVSPDKYRGSPVTRGPLYCCLNLARARRASNP